MRAILLTSILALVTLAGCTDTSDSEPGETVTPDEPQFVDPDSDFQVDRPSLPVDRPAPGERTLDEVPTWRLGEWWKIRITDSFTGQTRDVTRIVAGTEHGNYLVGFPLEEFSNDVLVLHFPGYGDIKRDDLSYDAHDQPYVPLQFPLVEGDSWTTKWQAETSDITITVERAGNGTADLLVTGAASGTMTYDAETGAIQRWIMNGYADYEVVDHGYNYTGAVRVPHDHDLIFFHGRIAGAMDAAAPFPSTNPVLPMEDIVIDGSYDRLSFAHILLDITGTLAQGSAQLGTSGGVYQITTTAPDGTVYEDILTPADGQAVRTVFYGHEAPEGTWSMQAVAGGAGVALLEGIGYHSIDIDLPSGCVVASANADHHTLGTC